jgi:hypothetical protein
MPPQTGDAHIIRNAGGIVIRRRTTVAHHLPLPALHPRDHDYQSHRLRLLSFKDEELRARLRSVTGTDSVTPSHFHLSQTLRRTSATNPEGEVPSLATQPRPREGIRLRRKDRQACAKFPLKPCAALSSTSRL